MKPKTLAVSSLACSLGMGFFAFCILGYFSDTGLRFGFEIPVSTKTDLTFFTDAFYLAAPFCLLLGCLAAYGSPRLSRIGLVFCSAPMACYGAGQLLQILEGKEVSLPFLLTQLVFLLLGAGGAVAALWPFSAKAVAGLSLGWAGAEAALLLLSLFSTEQFSQYYLSGYLGRDGFRYTHVLISPLLTELCYLAALGLRLWGFAAPTPEEDSPDETENDPPEPPSDSDEEENESPLSLEDFGIER